MPTKSVKQPKKTVTELREENEKLKDLLENGFRCMMCDTVKKKDKFYVNTHPLCKSGVTQICKECARKIAHRVDKNGEEHEPTKESVIETLFWLNKPFKESVWNASIQESENLVSGKVRSTPYMSYVKNIAMQQWVGASYFDSDFLKEKVIYEDEQTEENIIKDHSGQDTYDSYLKNKSDVIRLLDYDPFEKEALSEQPFLYAQLLGMLDSNEEANDDMMRTSACITIVRGFLQASKIDDTVAKLMSDITKIEKNSATIKSLQESKSKIMSIIKDMAAENCISLAHTKNSTKGENTWGGKIRKIRDLNLREGRANGFDIGTSKGMRQVREISDASIMKQLALDDSEWSDMVAEMRETIVSLRNELDQYREINRILLQENLDLKDYFEEKGISFEKPLVNLSDIYSVFAGIDDEEMEVDADESDIHTEQ